MVFIILSKNKATKVRNRSGMSPTGSQVADKYIYIYIKVKIKLSLYFL